MQGIGNDFILIDDLGKNVPSPLTPAVAKRLCDRRFGIGADQILWLRRPEGPQADARMEILNADGSTAEMCGNGIRAVGLYLFREGPRRGKAEYAIETLGGMKRVEVHGDQVTVDMGAPGLGENLSGNGEELEIAGEGLRFFEVSMGNPHAVFFVEDVASIPLEKLGPLVEKHPRFPNRTNVEFVEILNANEIRVRVWERGAGVTLACGTGACASAVAALAKTQVSGKVAVHLPGGTLKISWAGAGKPVMMEGPAEEVFRGECFV
jgi:diaminopimelate epimerase